VATLEQVQERIRSRITQAPKVRKLEWMRISQLVVRADDYEIHRNGQVGHFAYNLYLTPFHRHLWGPSETAQECMETAALHQVLL
jgi:hypothetical protein